MAKDSDEKDDFLNLREITRADVLRSERNKCVIVITREEIQIEILEEIAKTEPDKVVGRKVGAINPQTGEPMSYVSVTAKEMLKESKKTKEDRETRMAAIDRLIAKV